MSSRKARIEAAGNGWILICTEHTVNNPGGRLEQKLVFAGWGDMIKALEGWLGPRDSQFLKDEEGSKQHA